MLSEEHLFSVFNELGVPLGLDGDLPPGCGGALGGAKPPAPYPARAARPAASWDEPGGGGASASDAQASSEPDLDDEDDSGEDSGPARGRVGTRGRARASGRGRGRGRPDGRARGRGQVRPRPRELEVWPRFGWSRGVLQPATRCSEHHALPPSRWAAACLRPHPRSSLRAGQRQGRRRASQHLLDRQRWVVNKQWGPSQGNAHAQDADEWTDGEDEEADVGGGRGRVKRVMANRQSAQRSRMRKLQFISDLEAEVNRLQADLEQLAPAVAALRTKHAGARPRPVARRPGCARLGAGC